MKSFAMKTELKLAILLRCPICEEEFSVDSPLLTVIDVPEIVACVHCGYRPINPREPKKLGARHRIVQVARRAA